MNGGCMNPFTGSKHVWVLSHMVPLWLYMYIQLMDSTALPRRNNLYDHSEEFWIIVKETGKRQESASFEEIHERQKKACQHRIQSKSLAYIDSLILDLDILNGIAPFPTLGWWWARVQVRRHVQRWWCYQCPAICGEHYGEELGAQYGIQVWAGLMILHHVFI